MAALGELRWLILDNCHDQFAKDGGTMADMAA